MAALLILDDTVYRLRVRALPSHPHPSHHS
jgi:hypothetical protein